VPRAPPPRVQVFHVLHSADEGGRTLLVDGFRAAWRLRRRRPDAFALLARVPVMHQFSEGGDAGGGDAAGGGDDAGGRRHRHLLRATHTVIGTTPTATGEHGELLMMRYNNYDRLSLALSGHEEARRWYRAPPPPHRAATATQHRGLVPAAAWHGAADRQLARAARARGLRGAAPRLRLLPAPRRPHGHRSSPRPACLATPCIVAPRGGLEEAQV
ncbi:uncharacterized protein LOC144952161, partial [Lampetra fluviatilis]